MYVYVCMYVCVCDPYYGEGVLEYLLHLVDATDRLRGEALAVAADHAHAGAAVGEAGEENIIYIYGSSRGSTGVCASLHLHQVWDDRRRHFSLR
jgi:hypothetical protein